MTTTPGELEEDLDVSAKTIRAFLCEEYPEHELGTRWELDDPRRPWCGRGSRTEPELDPWIHL